MLSKESTNSRYTYDLASRTTTTTNPDGGQVITTSNAHGDVVTKEESVSATETRTTTYAYDSNYNLTSETNDLGETIGYTYDGKGNQASISVSSSINPVPEIIINMGYNQYGGLTQMTDSMGKNIQVAYDPTTFMPLSASDTISVETGKPLGSYTWDSHGNPETQTDAEGHTTHYEYDQYGHTTRTYHIIEVDGVPVEIPTTFTYDLLGRQQTVTDALGNTTSYTYDALGRVLTEEIVDDNNVHYKTTYGYDRNGNRTSVTDPRGNTTTFEYDAANNLTKIIYPGTDPVQNRTVTREYDFRGNVVLETDQLGRETIYEYDLAGQLIRVTAAKDTLDETVTQYVYDEVGRTKEMIDGRGNSTFYFYNDRGRMIRTEDEFGHILNEYTYSDTGLMESITDANGHTTWYKYDDRENLIKTIFDAQDAQGQPIYTETTYNGIRQPITVRDQNGKITSYTYDQLGRLESVTNPTGNETVIYTYDEVGNLKKIIDAEGHITSFDYDDLNRQTIKTWPDGKFETFAYDLAGNMTEHHLADNPLHINQYDYDEMNRLTQITTYDGQEYTFTYTATGQRDLVTDVTHNLTTNYDYDALDRLTAVIHSDGNRVNYQYDDAGNRTQMTTLAGATTIDQVGYTYDWLNRLTQVTSLNAGTTTYTYGDVANSYVGLLERMTLPNGIITDYDYDALNRLDTITEHNTVQTLASYNYTLDDAGNRVAVEEADGSSIEWGYDDAYRLTSETRLNASNSVVTQTSFTYDLTGNRASQTTDGVTVNYTYNNLDQLLTAGTQTFTYDDRGNLIQTSDPATGTTTYTFDALDRMTGVTLPDSTVIAYTYDHDNRRIQQAVGSDITNYLWDEMSPYGDVVAEFDGTNALEASYVLGGTRLISQTRGGVDSYYLFDAMSVRNLTSAAGIVTDAYDYTAFGDTYSQSGTTVNSYQYTGQYQDAVTELYNLRARHYDPVVGRFLSRDKLNCQICNATEINRYVYVGNSPITLFDPTGYEALVSYQKLVGVLGGVGAISLPPLGTKVVTDFLLILAALVFANQALQDLGYFTKGGKQNKRNHINDEVDALAKTVERKCEILDEWYKAEKNAQRKRAIREAQKYLGCANSQKRDSRGY